MTSGQGTWPGSHSQQPAAHHPQAPYQAPQQPPGAPAPSGLSTGTNQDDSSQVHTYLYYPGFAAAVILGLVLAFVIYFWISDHASGVSRIPIWLLALPCLVLVAIVRFGDEHLARAFPGLVPASKRAGHASAGAPGHSGEHTDYPPHPYVQHTGNAPQTGRAGRVGYGQPGQPGQVGQVG